MLTPTTPLAHSTAAALARVLDNIPRGYTRYTCGTIAAAKLPALVSKFHRCYAVAASPAQRMTRRKHGKANAVLSLYLPAGASTAHWMMLFTEGELEVHERLCSIYSKPQLRWLGYELTRYAHKGGTRWTWRRPKDAMQELYMLLAEPLARRRWPAVSELLARIAAQPGFHGVRGQSWRLCQEAKQHGYPGQLPMLFYMQKINHGERISVV
ncbi:hypothetical protein [Delftia sp. UME58]|uniref:hypothetical protein n=1 Tax=Delftia sp. UME58 TaxID=1862322 RepID=UPI0015FFB0D8|nr:hypothetical protein [Delftia sp. UME58]MBB1647971.1 hypothetical protein [Delftia sp. UME58]